VNADCVVIAIVSGRPLIDRAPLLHVDSVVPQAGCRTDAAWLALGTRAASAK